MLPENQFEVSHSRDHVLVKFRHKHAVLSSAVLNGGFRDARNILIMKVSKNIDQRQSDFEEPAVTLANYCRTLQLKGTSVGMMTAASMNSFRRASRTWPEADVTVLITAGISNARCAGDHADWIHPDSALLPKGTINTIVMTQACLSRAAMVEAVMLATEAKAVALRELGIKSPVSGAFATGTGTDAIVIVSGNGPAEIRYSGKHVKFGEMLAAAVIEAVTDSLGACAENPDYSWTL